MVYIGIDPGVETGVGYRLPKNANVGVKTLKIHNAMALVNYLVRENDRVHVRIEDARKRKWFGGKGKNDQKQIDAKKQGAGSVKRDCSIWEAYLDDLQKEHPQKLTFEMLHPVKDGTKYTSRLFVSITGIQGRTSSHARDAYMLIHEYTYKSI
ncbi:hypothetical protein C7967_11526 [Thalassospira sp. 11-3]|nr:hypothetical protein C7967_11526 [Thalassospira sp. 11-3]